MGVPTAPTKPTYDLGEPAKLSSHVDLDQDPSKGASSSPGDPEGQEWLTRDDAALEGLGYRPELKRNFSSLETFGVAFSIMGVVPSIASTIFYNLPYGGPVGMVWGWFLSSILIMFIGLAMADLASSMPTSGGLYYWTYKLAPKKYAAFLSWMVGYNSFLGNVGATASVAWGCAGIILACGSVADESFSPSVGVTFGVYCGVLVTAGVFCAYGTSLFARMQTPLVILNTALALVTIIGLPIARRGHLNTASFTFTGWENLYSWPNGFAFFLSMLAPVWTICSFDCAVSISEEASNAEIAVPQAIVGSIGSAGILGTIFLAICALCMGPSVAEVNDSAIGQPLAYIYMLGFGRNGTLAIWAFIAVSSYFMACSLLLPSSRQAFAFSRDGALPFSSYLYKVDARSGTPVRTVWLVVGCCIPLGLLGFADPENQAAINAIFAIAILGPYVAYGIPIFSRVMWGQALFHPGPWYLGRASIPVAIIACIWMCFALVLFCFPADIAPTAGTMNYAIVVSAAVWAFAIAFWYFPKIGGKTFFNGPKTSDLNEELLQAYAEGNVEDPGKNAGVRTTVQAVEPDADADAEPAQLK